MDAILSKYMTNFFEIFILRIVYVHRGCNNPINVNRLPNAMNARIPNETLNRLLTGGFISNCYRCDICLDEDVLNTDMTDCELLPCYNDACNFVATRSSTTGPAECDGGWHFRSGCILSREPAQVDMTLMYYLGSKTTVIYQMEAICLSDSCNNFTTFRQLKNAVTVDPDLSCFINGTNPSTITPASSTAVTGTGSTSSGASTTATVSAATTTRGSTTTPTPSSGEQNFLNAKLFIFIIFFFFYIIKF